MGLVSEEETKNQIFCVRGKAVHCLNNMKLSVAPLILTSFLSLVHAQEGVPPNDDCANAIVINPSSIPIYGNTTLATLDNERENTCQVFSQSSGLWYKLTSSTFTDVTASTCNSGTNFDTQISVFVGNDCNSLSCVGSNDDQCIGNFRASTYSFLAEPNKTYWVVVHGYLSGAGFFGLTVSFSPLAFLLMNSITDLVLGKLETSISYSRLPTSRLNIQSLYASDVAPRSVRMTFDNPPRNFCENVPPFSVFGDSNGVFFNGTIPVGRRVVTATPYNASNCQGPAGPVQSQEFLLDSCSSINYKFVDVAYDSQVPYNFVTRKLTYLPCSLNVQVTFRCGFQANEVKMELLNNATEKLLTSRIERSPPYFLFGDVRGTPLSGSVSPGTYRLRLTIDGIVMNNFIFSATNECAKNVPPNDGCPDAIPLALNSTVPTRVIGDTTFAVVDEFREQYCGIDFGSSALWYKFTTPSAPFFANVSPTTCSNVTTGSTFVNVASGNCDDLSCVNSKFQDIASCEKVSIFLKPGTTYFITVHSKAKSGGVFELRLEYDPNLFLLVNPINNGTIDVLRDIHSYHALPSSQLNIMATYDTALPVPKSVRLTFDNPPSSICDNTPPFSVFGDLNGDFNNTSIPVGSHVVTATPFDDINCQGTAGSTRNQNFTLEKCPMELRFYNAQSGRKIMYSSNELVSLPCSVNIRAFIFRCFPITEVKLELYNSATNRIVVSRTERVAPYFLFGDVRGKMLGGEITPGIYLLKVIVDGIEMDQFPFSVLEECGNEPPCMSICP